MQDNFILLDQMKALNIEVVNLKRRCFYLDLFRQVKKVGFKFYVWSALEVDKFKLL